MAHSYPSTAYQEFTYFPKWEMPSMRIKYSFQIGGFGKVYFYYSLLRREECTILSQGPVGQNRYALWPSRPLDCPRADQTAGLCLTYVFSLS